MDRGDETGLAGKRILLTGGTTGIGRATLAALAKDGARLLTFGRTEAPLEEAAAVARAAGGEVHAIVADAATRDGIATVFDAVDTTLGGIDMLVACAALGADPAGADRHRHAAHRTAHPEDPLIRTRPKGTRP